MKIECPECGKHYAVSDEATGKRVQCQNAQCRHSFVVEAQLVPGNGKHAYPPGAAGNPALGGDSRPAPVAPPPLPAGRSLPETDATLDSLVSDYETSAKPSEATLRQQLKNQLEATRKLAHAVKLRHDIRKLEKTLDEPREKLGKLTLQHRPSEVDADAEIAELKHLQEDLKEEQATLESLRNTKGSGSVARELKRKIAEQQTKQRALMVEIGLKADTGRPDMPDASEAYRVIDHLLASLETKRTELAELAVELPASPDLRPMLGGVTSWFAERRRLLITLGSVALGCFILYFAWGLVVSPLFEGALPKWTRPYIPDNVKGVVYVNYETLRESDVYQDFVDGNPLAKPAFLRSLEEGVSRSRGVSMDDFSEFLLLLLDGDEVVSLTRRVEPTSLEDNFPKGSKPKVKTYRGYEYASIARDNNIAQLDARTICWASSEKTLKRVLANAEKGEEHALSKDLDRVLRFVAKQDHYFVLKPSDVSGVMLGTGFRGNRAGKGGLLGALSPAKEPRTIGFGISLDSSRVFFSNAMNFRRERDAEKIEQQVQDATEDLEAELDDMSDSERKMAEIVLANMKKISIWHKASCAYATSDLSMDDIEELTSSLGE